MTNSTSVKTKILCVDDDPIYGELYRQILEPAGFSVVVKMNPDAGFDAVMSDHCALMILDVMMPESGKFRDGFGLLEALRSDARTKRLPVIMVSALGNEDDVRHGLALGATDFIPKQELTPHRLVDVIEKHVEK